MRLAGRLSYANVMATLAFFIAIGGGAYAAFRLPPNSVRSKNIVNGQVRSADIGTGQVGSRAVGNNALTGNDINESTLNVPGTTQKLFYQAASGDPVANFAVVGPWTLKAQCYFDTTFRLYWGVDGPSGTANGSFVYAADDSAGPWYTRSLGKAIPSFPLVGAVNDPGQIYARTAGTVFLQSGTTLAQIDFNMVANTSGADSCFIFGSATLLN